MLIIALSSARAADPAHIRVTSTNGGWNAEPFIDPLVVDGAGQVSVTVTKTPVFVIVDP